MRGLHVGCGGHKIAGFDNFDIELDISKTPLPFENESYDAVFASHVLEHISGPEMLRFMTEVHRVLKPGGWFRLSIPVVGPWLDRHHARDLCLGHGHLAIFNEELVRTFFWMAGFDQQKVRRVERSEFDHHHKTIGVEKDDIESARFYATK